MPRPKKHKRVQAALAMKASQIRVARIAALKILQNTSDPAKDESNSDGQPKTYSRQGTFGNGLEKLARRAKIENVRANRNRFKPGTPICLICRDGCSDSDFSDKSATPTPARHDVGGSLKNHGIQSQEFNLTNETVAFLFKRLISLPADKIKEFEILKIDEKPVWNYVGFCAICQRILENAIITTKKIEELHVEISKLQGQLQQSKNKMENLFCNLQGTAKSSKSLVDVVPLVGKRQERKRLWNLMKEIRLKIINSSCPPSENIIENILPTVSNPVVSKFQKQSVSNKLKKSREISASKTQPQPQQYPTILSNNQEQDLEDDVNNSAENFEDSFPIADYTVSDWDEEFLESDSEDKKTSDKNLPTISKPIYKILKSQLIQRRAADYLAVDPLAPSEIFWHHERYMNAGADEYLNAPMDPIPEVSEVRRCSMTTKIARNKNPCGICKEVFDTPMEASQHRRYIHPGLSLCTGPPGPGTLQCRKIFHSHEIKQHRLEAHPLFKCSECVEAFSSSELLSTHMQKEHYKSCPFENLNDVEESLTVKPLNLETIEAHAAPSVVLKRCFNLRDFKKLPGEQFVRFSLDDEDNVKLLGLLEKSKPEEGPRRESEKPQDCDFDDEDMLIKEEFVYDDDDDEPEEIPEQNSLPEMEDFDQFAPTLSPIPEGEEEKSPKPEPQQTQKPYIVNFLGRSRYIQDFEANQPPPPAQPPPPRKRLYKCGICNSTFKDQAVLTTHFSENHNVSSKFGCYVCRKAFDSVALCEAHIASDHPPATLPITRKTTITSSVFGRGGRDENWCFNCRSAFETSAALSEHKKNCQMESGIEPKLLSCPEDGCDRKGFTETGLKIHFSSAHNTTTEKEGYPSMLKYRLLCPEPGCEIRLTSELQVLRHKLKCHNITSERKCAECPLMFPYDPPYHAEYKQHFQKAHPKTAKCPVCEKEMRESKIKLHIKYKHENIPRPRPYICEVCGKSLTNANFLQHHVAIHSEDRPFLCHLCGKDFKTKNNLYIHGWSHDPDRRTKWSAYKPKPKKPGQKKRVRKTQTKRVRVGKPANNVDSQMKTINDIDTTNTVMEHDDGLDS